MTTKRDELLGVIRTVRGRWRLKIALRGAALVLGAGVLAVALSAWGMEHYRFTPESIVAFRVLTYVALLAITARFVVLPLWRRPSDEQVALYVEEHEPSLETALLTAVGEEGERGKREGVG